MKEFRISFISFLTGVASGIILGMMLTPDQSEKKKEKLSKDLEKMSHKFREEIDRQYEDTVDRLADVQKSADNYVDKKMKSANK